MLTVFGRELSIAVDAEVAAQPSASAAALNAADSIGKCSRAELAQVNRLCLDCIAF